MSWASKRTTKRVEDRAYSLLGIFDVRMPMLYGEGTKAFLRLQEEIIKQSDDQSLFAWQGIDSEQPGMLALKPEYFATGRNITNGSSINLSLKPWTRDTYLAILECSRTPANADSTGRPCLMGIFLRRLTGDDQYARVTVHGVEIVTIPLPEEGLTEYLSVSVHVPQAKLQLNEMTLLAQKRNHGIRISTELLKHDSKGRNLFEIEGNLREGGEKAKYAPGSVVYGHVGTLNISQQKGSVRYIKLGFDFEFNPICLVATHSINGQRSHATDKPGWSDWAGDWELTIGEGHGRQSIYDRSRKERLEWSKITALGVAQIDDARWVFKGDRLEGFSHLLVSSFRPYRADIEASMKRETKDGQTGWVFELEQSTR
ncbi:hypothetical protein MMC26_005347 [Xylographa opegraphella]|nr:hypothetical protein [Xylographa opegraphella]